MSVSLSLHHKLDRFDLSVEFEAPAGVTALFGASGSGKTTLIQAVAGLITPERGHVRIGEKVLLNTAQNISLPAHKRRLGYVFQEGRLFPHLSVRQNLRYGRWFAGLRGGSAEEHRLVEMLGLGALLERRPGDLSGGEKQRVAIGRALLSQPEMLLMDEPLAALDAPRKAEILPYLERLRDETRIPILYVSHSIGEVARLATTVAVLDQGKLVRIGPAQEVLSDPGTVPAIGLRDAGSLLSGRIVAHHADGLSEVEAAGGRLFLPHVSRAIGDPLRIRIQAKDVMLSLEKPRGISALNILAGEITSIRQGNGPGAIVQILCGDDPLLARLTKRSVSALGLAPGTACHAVIKTVSVAQSDVGAQGASHNTGEDAD